MLISKEDVENEWSRFAVKFERARACLPINECVYQRKRKVQVNDSKFSNNGTVYVVTL